MNDTLIYHAEDADIMVCAYGRAVAFDPSQKDQSCTLARLEELTKDIPYTTAIWQRLPNHKKPDGLRRVREVRNERPFGSPKAVYNYGDRYDGVFLMSRGTAAIFITNDCHTYIGVDTTGASPPMMLHCGRDSLHNDMQSGTPEESVISRAMEQYLAFGGSVTNLRGQLLMGIAPKHFNNEQYPALCQKLAERWGNSVIRDKKRLTIDLVELIRKQFGAYGVIEDQILHDRLDTYSDNRLGSLRAGKTDLKNVIVVARL